MSFDFETFEAECPVAILVIAEEGTIVFANRALASLLGFGLKELEGTSVAAIVPERLHPPPEASWVRHLTERAGSRMSLACLLSHRSKTEIETDWTLLPGHDATGRPHLHIVVSQRAAELKGPASERREVAAALPRALFESAPIGILHFDREGTVTECNDRFVSVIGSSRRHLIGLKMLTLPDRAMADCAKSALSGDISTYEGAYTSATGNKTSWVRVTMAPMNDPSGAVIGGVGLVEDATEQRRVSEIVAATERLASLGTLAAGVVHEVQNPLAYVMASLDLALRQLEGTADRDELRATLTAAREGVTRVAGIARDLKTFARSDESLRGPVDVAAVLDTAIKLTDAPVRNRATIQRRIEPVGMVWASEPRLVQLFVNLLLNAAEAIPEGDAEGQSIVISARELPDHRIRVDVEDTGSGISEEDAARIFEPFWTSKESGMGLGLTICLGIVSSIGGEIFVDRDRPAGAVGSRIAVILPPATGRTSSSGMYRVTPTVSIPAPPERGRVLIVDDEQRLAETLRMSLSASHEVQTANRGRRALELLFGDDEFDVVLCDLLMPDLTGAELYAIVAEKRPELAEKFVFLTGGAFSEGIREFLQQVPNPRIEKPFDLEDLERLIEERVAAARCAGVDQGLRSGC